MTTINEIEAQAFHVCAEVILRDIEILKKMWAIGTVPSLPHSFNVYEFREGEHHEIEGRASGNPNATWAPLCIPDIVKQKQEVRDEYGLLVRHDTIGHVFWDIGHDTPATDFEIIFEKVPAYSVAVHLAMMFLREELYQGLEAHENNEIAEELAERREESK